MESTAKEAKDATKDKLDSWGLTSDNIKDELARTGKVIRQKTQGTPAPRIADAAADTRITADIKAKFGRGPGPFHALNISRKHHGGTRDVVRHSFTRPIMSAKPSCWP